MTARAGRERGQTLVVFALVLSLFLVGMLALTADLGALYVAYNRADAAALLAVQSGASEVDRQALYGGTLRLDSVRARAACESSLRGSGVDGGCDAASGRLVVARVDESVRLPVPLLGVSAPVHLVRSATPVYGGASATVTP